MFIAFNSFVHTLLGIAFLCCKVFEIVKVGSSMHPASRAFFLVCFLPCTRCSCGRHSRRLACLHLHVLCAYCNFESKQAISVTLFGRHANNNLRSCLWFSFLTPDWLFFCNTITVQKCVWRSQFSWYHCH